MSSVGAISFKGEDLKRVDPGKPVKMDFEMPKLPEPPSQVVLDTQIAIQKQRKVHSVFQVDGKIIGNVVIGGGTETNNGATISSRLGQNLSSNPEIRSQQVAEYLQNKYPGLEVITFDNGSAPTIKEYHERLLSGGTFSSRSDDVNSDVLGQSKSAWDYDLFRNSFI